MSGYAGYAAAAGQRFRLPDGTELTLHEVTAPVEQGDFVGWSLCFRGPAGQPLQQGIHALTNDELGDVEIFLVPLGPVDADTFEYEAVFSNRHTEASA